jgi:hypothetical protein
MNFAQFLHRFGALTLLTASAVATLPNTVAIARPLRGSVPWSVILCKSSDGGTPLRDVTYSQNLVVNGGTGGLADYWQDVSYQNVNLVGSEVHGWYTVPKIAAEWQAMSDRSQKVAVCQNAAQSDPTQPFTVPTGHRTLIVTFPNIDEFGWNGGAFVDSNVAVGDLVHEGGHGIALNHSFSNDFAYLNIWWAQIGEYDDPWDAMSWGNVFRVPTPFGDGPSWMIAYNLDRMGWLPRSRIVNFGSDGVSRATITLAAVGHPEAPGALLIRVPFDVSDPMHYYTLEFRREDRWDAGIPADAILLHEVQKSWTSHGDYLGHPAALLLTLASAGREPLQTLTANGVSIQLDSINTAANTATVTIVSSFPDHCMLGFVWREVRSYDHVCVTPDSRASVRDEDNHASERRSPTGGPFGPDTCKQGFVWREAIVPSPSLEDPPDHVCVPAAARDREGQNNLLAASRKNPAQLTFGPNTCKTGFVWREVDDWDWVCVTPAVRGQGRDDNAGGEPPPARRGPIWSGYLQARLCLASGIPRRSYLRYAAHTEPSGRR